jgi:predicted transcriptional regulator YdeE
MEPKIVTLGPLYLVGRPYYGSPEGGAFGQAWERFNAEHKQITEQVNAGVYYGLEVYGPEFMTAKKWSYMPAVAVSDLANQPVTLFGKMLPACTYAVFTAQHGLASIPEAFMYGYNTWIPASRYRVAYPFDFELYDDARFHGDGPNEEIDVYIPIQEKAAQA